jgi:U2 small nuclear ribonucleoprotein B''
LLVRPALKRNLHALFTPYGRLLDIVALKRNKMRGQAHVVFESIEGAAKGLRGLNNFPFFGRPLVSDSNVAEYRSKLASGGYEAE